jgi:hypothetical protein
MGTPPASPIGGADFRISERTAAQRAGISDRGRKAVARRLSVFDGHDNVHAVVCANKWPSASLLQDARNVWARKERGGSDLNI